jgi:flavin-dependent dehydrogenase
MTNNDVVILGGGPAGLAAALELARNGATVTVLERSKSHLPRVGETLSPSARMWLGSLGLWERFLRDGHRRSAGTTSIWGISAPYQNDFFTSPYGPGWHLDRLKFDQMFAHAAAQSGASIVYGVRVNRCCRGLDHSWRISASIAADTREFRGRFLIDALGRQPSPARPAAWRKYCFDRLVGVVATFRESPCAETSNPRITIEAVEHGWWYTALLPKQRRVAAFMTDTDLVGSLRARDAQGFQRLWAHTSLTKAQLSSCRIESPPRVVAANSYLTWPVADYRRIAVGDAAAARDPLSSEGIEQAILTGTSAARAILASAEPESSFEQYQRSVIAEFVVYLATQLRYYAKERRWPHSPFWQRRNRLRDHEPAAAKAEMHVPTS